MSGGQPDLEPGQFNAVRKTVTRVFEARGGSQAIGLTALQIDKTLDSASVEGILRDGRMLDLSDGTAVAEGDIVAISGAVTATRSAGDLIGPEVPAPDGFQLVEEDRVLVLTNRKWNGRSLRA
jgi:putative transport protein